MKPWFYKTILKLYIGGEEKYEDQQSLYAPDPYYDYGYGQSYDGAYGTDTGYSGGSAGYSGESAGYGSQSGYSDYGYGYPEQGNAFVYK